MRQPRNTNKVSKNASVAARFAEENLPSPPCRLYFLSRACPLNTGEGQRASRAPYLFPLRLRTPFLVNATPLATRLRLTRRKIVAVASSFIIPDFRAAVDYPFLQLTRRLDLVLVHASLDFAMMRLSNECPGDLRYMPRIASVRGGIIWPSGYPISDPAQ
jgi:hypothetical protein